MDKHGREAGLLQRSPFAVVALDPSLRVTAWTGAATRMFGVTEAQALGAAIPDVIAVAGTWAVLVAEAGDGPRVATCVGPDGASLSVAWTIDVARDGAGQVVSIVCYGHDVTAQVAQEATYKLEGMMLRAILDNLNIIAWTMEKDGVCTYHQGKGLASIGQHAGAFVGMNIREMYRDLDPTPLDRVFEGTVQFANTEVHGQSFENWMIPMRGEHGDVACMVALSLNVTEQRRGEQAEREKLAQIEDQQRTIRSLSTPIVEVWDRVLSLPIIGIVDGERAAAIMDNLLQAVTARRARFAILDMTGVTDIDTATAGHLLDMVRAIRLLGAEGILTGIHPNIARMVVDLGVELPNLTVRASMREALALCITRLHAAARPRA